RYVEAGALADPAAVVRESLGDSEDGGRASPVRRDRDQCEHRYCDGGDRSVITICPSQSVSTDPRGHDTDAHGPRVKSLAMRSPSPRWSVLLSVLARLDAVKRARFGASSWP